MSERKACPPATPPLPVYFSGLHNAPFTLVTGLAAIISADNSSSSWPLFAITEPIHSKVKVVKPLTTLNAILLLHKTTFTLRWFSVVNTTYVLHTILISRWTVWYLMLSNVWFVRYSRENDQLIDIGFCPVFYIINLAINLRRIWCTVEL